MWRRWRDRLPIGDVQLLQQHAGTSACIVGGFIYSTLALLGFGGVIFWRDSGRVYLRWVFYLTALGFAFDLYLAYVMVFRIQAVCWLCISTYVVNVAMILMLIKPIWKEPKPRGPMRAIFPGIRDAQGIDLYYRNAIKGLLILWYFICLCRWCRGFSIHFQILDG